MPINLAELDTRILSLKTGDEVDRLLAQKLEQWLVLARSLNPQFEPSQICQERICRKAEIALAHHEAGKLFNPEITAKIAGEKTPDQIKAEFYGDVVKEVSIYDGRKYCEKYGIHFRPCPSPAAVFSAAQKLRHEYDVGVGIGPEGIPIARMFELAGMPILNIWIDENDGSRPYRILDSLDTLAGKRALLLEDDVVTGKTLDRAVEVVEPYKPATLALFLALPLVRQTLGRVPRSIQKTILLEQIPADKESANNTLFEYFRKQYEVEKK